MFHENNVSQYDILVLHTSVPAALPVTFSYLGLGPTLSSGRSNETVPARAGNVSMGAGSSSSSTSASGIGGGPIKRGLVIDGLGYG